MSPQTTKTTFKVIFWTIIPTAILTALGIIFSSYGTIQTVKSNDARQDQELDTKASKEMVIAVKNDCEKNIEKSNKDLNGKLDLILTFYGVNTAKLKKDTLGNFIFQIK